MGWNELLPLSVPLELLCLLPRGPMANWAVTVDPMSCHGSNDITPWPQHLGKYDLCAPQEVPMAFSERPTSPRL